MEPAHPIHRFRGRNLVDSRWRACGGDIWVLLDEPILHIGTNAYGGSYLDTLTEQARR